MHPARNPNRLLAARGDHRARCGGSDREGVLVILRPTIYVDSLELHEANKLLERWGHLMGPCNRGNGFSRCHALYHEEMPQAVTITSGLIRESVAGVDYLNRSNCIELSRLCAKRPGLCRVMIRLWREFVFPQLGYQYAISYQDSALHSGATYRFDGWERVSFSHSGKDSRSGRQGRDKYVWLWKLK